jgi:flagellar biosynthesis protein FlhF
MQLKRYRVATVAEALNRARAEMGPDALVLSTRLVRARGVRGWLGARGVEVTVAIERGMSEHRPPCPAVRHDQRPAEDAIVARLRAGGLDATFAREVAATLPRGARRGASLVGLRGALAARLTTLTAGGEPFAPIEVFVGPPGAGKTTTIAKIGAQERARRGRRMSLVAADAYRVGAIEQLRMYAEIIGSPFLIAHSASELDRAFASAESSMLVDTAGRSPNDPAARDLFAAIGRRRDVRTHLVMPAGTSAADAARIFDRYGDAHPDRVVLTRVDEAETVSPLLTVLRNRQVPISYLGTGQRVPEDLFPATSPLVAACVLGEGVAALEALR